jgi:hypothetical protein
LKHEPGGGWTKENRCLRLIALPARRVPEVLDSRTLSESGVRCVFASLSAGLVRVANQYAWCSAAWFESNARSGFVKSVYSFNTDRITVRDDF